MKILFLDHDGVICLSNNWGTRHKKMTKYSKSTGVHEKPLMPVEVRMDSFDQKAVKVLNEVLEITGAEIVISSDWKLHATFDELCDLYEKSGISKKPIATTDNMQDFDPENYNMYSWKGWVNRARVVEIRKFLNENPSITHWVAIDDLWLGKSNPEDPGLDNFVLTRRPMSEGIKQSGIKEELLSYLK